MGMWEYEAAGFREKQPVIAMASQLQQKLLQRGFYDKGVSCNNRLLRTAAWLELGLLTLHAHGVWCPDSVINIEG